VAVAQHRREHAQLRAAAGEGVGIAHLGDEGRRKQAVVPGIEPQGGNAGARAESRHCRHQVAVIAGAVAFRAPDAARHVGAAERLPDGDDARRVGIGPFGEDLEGAVLGLDVDGSSLLHAM
jgi:hypothetical protein